MLAVETFPSGLSRTGNSMMDLDPPPPRTSSRANLRSDDTIRATKALRFDVSEPGPATETAAPVPENVTAQAKDDASMSMPPPKMVAESTRPDLSLLSLEETTELFRRKIADAKQDTEHALAGSEVVSDAVRPKLTLDLGHSRIQRLPESVIDLIKTEVERLSLSQNSIWHIPLRLAECNHLRYLNIRSNVFRDFPKGIYRLAQLEILDISRNKIKRIPPDIGNLKSLRVFSIVHNKVTELPAEIAEMTKLQILKVAENPLNTELKSIMAAKESEVSFSEMTDHEKDSALTLEIKRHLRGALPPSTPPEVDVSQPLEDGPMETPKPLKRVMSSRFPVIPSNGSVDSGSDGNKSSPLQGNPPPIPTRSHFRMTSGNQSLSIRRPGIAPLISQSNNADRNRSNSESVLQASAAARQKRMGMMRKEKPELQNIDEIKINRNSHLRGFSHGSVLKKNGTLASPGAHSSSPSSPRDTKRNRLAFVKRLSSLPEHKVDSEWNSPVIEGAKGVLYALYQVHPHISGLIAAIRGKDVRRSTLEFTFFNASTHVDRLNEALEQVDIVDEEDPDAIEAIEKTVRRDCVTCIMAYTHVTAQLQDNVKKIVAGTDGRYVRTLMLLLYGSMMEIRNAIQAFGADIKIAPTLGHRRQMSSGNAHTIETIPEEFVTPEQPARAATPTRDKAPPARYGARLRSDTTIQHPLPETIHPPASISTKMVKDTPPSSVMNLTGTTMNGSTYNTLSSTMSNGNTMGSTNSSRGSRSRSNSRTHANMSNGSNFSSVANTPRSGEGFSLPPPTTYLSRINPNTGLTDQQEEAVFEQIFLALTKAYDAALQAIPVARDQFFRYREAAEENRQPKNVTDLWSTLIYRCKVCIDISEALQIRLVNMRIKDPSVHASTSSNGRNDPSLWMLSKSFLSSFVHLLTDMREAKSMRLLPNEMIMMLRPLSKATKEAGRLIETSPWSYLTGQSNGAMPPPPPPNSYNTNGAQPMTNGNGYMNGMNGYATSNLHTAPHPPPLVPVPPIPYASAAMTPSSGPKQMLNGQLMASGMASNGVSPVSVPLPATPLSAALGPAAQATVPVSAGTGSFSGMSGGSFGGGTVPGTPASGYGDFFKGDVFQRADSLMSMPRAGGVDFLYRR